MSGMSLRALPDITLEIDIPTLADLERQREEQKCVHTKMKLEHAEMKD